MVLTTYLFIENMVYFFHKNFILILKGRNMSFSTIKKAATLSLILFTFTMFVGCGGDEGKIKSTAKNLVKAMKKGDFDKAEKYLSKDAVKEMKEDLKEMDKEEKKKMVKAMNEMFKDIKYGEVKVDGEKATLKYTTKQDGKDREDEMPFVKEGGKWKVSF